jgi:hypothetical protein
LIISERYVDVVCCFVCVKAWGEASAVATAFKIGKNEANAAVNLMYKITPAVRALLQDTVRTHTMSRFINHDALASDVLVIGSAFNAAGSVWEDDLTNSQDLTMMIAERMVGDFTSLPKAMRKSWQLRDMDSIHKVCGIFLHMVSIFTTEVPNTFFLAEYPGIEKQFKKQFLDVELLNVYTNSVPPASLTAVSAFASSISKYRLAQAQIKQLTDDELAGKVMDASYAQLERQITDDWQLLRDHKTALADLRARDMKLDIQYVAARYAKGVEAVTAKMNAELCYKHTPELTQSVQDVNQFKVATGEG